ncbi:MAG: transporter substrate-binding domain-containing protein [Clostridia bacterium]|nr:transporter substrate-binding domain-containing protein [Clostridia bacterium]
MKKLIATTLAAVAALATIGMASCGGDNNNDTNKVKLIDVSLSSESYGVAVNKSDAALLESVNKVLTENADEIAAMIDVYESKNYEDDVPTDNSYVEGVVTYQESMSNNDAYLVMATDAPFAPWEYKVGENWGGIDIEIGQMIAEELGKTLAVKQTAFDTICMAVNNGDADIGLAGLTITPARQNTVTFSDPYYNEAYQVIVVKENDTRFDDCKTTAEIEAKLAELANGTKVGSQTGTTGAKYISGDKDDPDGFGFNGYANLTLKPYDTHADAVRDMVNGQVSLCIVDNLVAAQIVAQINAAA